MPKLALQYSILASQGFHCAYCTFPFGTLVRTERSDVLTSLQWDHFVPRSLVVYEDESNWVASCQLCNRIKHSHVFETLEEARDAVLVRWTDKRYTVLWVPSVSSEDDLDAWTLEYENREIAQVALSLPPAPVAQPPRLFMRHPMKCEECGETFDNVKNNPSRRFCGPLCSRKASDRRRLRTCKRCGVEYIAAPDRQEICCIETNQPHTQRDCRSDKWLPCGAWRAAGAARRLGPNHLTAKTFLSGHVPVGVPDRRQLVHTMSAELDAVVLDLFREENSREPEGAEPHTMAEWHLYGQAMQRLRDDGRLVGLEG